MKKEAVVLELMTYLPKGHQFPLRAHTIHMIEYA